MLDPRPAPQSHGAPDEESRVVETQTFPDAEGRATAPPRWSLANRLVWLAYLAIYPLPWFGRPPTGVDLAASGVGTAIFLVVYFDAYLSGRRTILPHVAAMALIGFALMPFGGAWSVFNIFASALACKVSRPKRAVIVLIGLQLALIAVGLASRGPWEFWASGVFFGAMSGFGTLVGADLERRNRLLVEAQGEVRRLAASAERERIAQDLHDLLGHTLTLVAVKADLAARLAEAEPSAARREMQEVAAAAREALAEVRSAVTGMKGASLAHEVERARTMLAAANLKTRIAVDAAALDPRREAVLAMALREAVTNVIRHAQATSCTIAVDLDPDGAMRLVVADDGRGGRIREGSGLMGMRARLSAAGGVLAVESGKEGTTLAARLPELAA